MSIGITEINRVSLLVIKCRLGCDGLTAMICKFQVSHTFEEFNKVYIIYTESNTVETSGDAASVRRVSSSTTHKPT